MARRGKNFRRQITTEPADVALDSSQVVSAMVGVEIASLFECNPPSSLLSEIYSARGNKYGLAAVEIAEGG
jgi:hypothetical protein